MKENNKGHQKKYYQYTREIRVDPGGAGDTVTIEDACIMASSITPRDIFNRVLIRVNNGTYIENELDIPSYTDVIGISTAGTNARDGILVLSGSGEVLTAADSWFMRMGDFTTVRNMTIFQGRLTPVSLAAPYSFIEANGWATIQDCIVVTNDTNYAGLTFPYYGINITGVDALFTIRHSSITSQGDETIGVRSNSPVIGHYAAFDGDPQGWLDLYHTDSAIKSSLNHCRMYTDLSFPAQKRAVDWVIRTSNVNTGVILTSTRVELDERDGVGFYQEMHPTPQQLSTAKIMNNRTVVTGDSVATRTTSAYTDGTIEGDTSAGVTTVFAPVFANALVGQEFTYKRRGANNMVVDGNGVNIDGGGTYTITIDLDSITISKNDASTWSII